MKKFPFQKIIEWHVKHSRENLPWREYQNNTQKQLSYRVWLSEIILQQTQVSRGKEYFEKIVKAFPTVESLSNTSYEVFFEYYKGLGYYSRARNMLKTAQIIVSDFGGIFPEDTISLVSLPGVGPYTAQAIQAFAYNQSVLSFDTNLLKIFSRFYFGNKYVGLTKIEIYELQKQFEKTQISGRKINNALMDFAQYYISFNGENNSFLQGNYPLQACKYYTTQGKIEPLKKKKKSEFPLKKTDIIIVLHENHKVYFSDNLDNYMPFFLTQKKISNREENKKTFRDSAKIYFKKKYGLDISVRPPHKKDFHNGKSYIICYAQIQKGQHNFGEFFDEKKNDINTNIIGQLYDYL